MARTSLTRIDAVERVTGGAKYAADNKRPGMLYGKILMSTVPHAEILKVDTGEAQRLPGVRAIITHKEGAVKWGAGERVKTRYAITDKARFIGDVIAAVAATDRDTAARAVELLQPDYLTLPSVTDLEDSLSGQVRIWPEGNLQEPRELKRGDLEKGFGEAEVVMSRVYKTPRHHGLPLETAASLAWWEGEKLNLVAATQGVSNCRTSLATDLGISPENVRVVCRYKGGGFGNKNSDMDYDLVAALLAKKADAPVLLEYNRYEDLVSVHSRWSTEQSYRLGMKRDGRITALDVVGRCNIGAYGRHPGGRYLQAAESLYPIPNLRLKVDPVYTNTPASGNVRAPAFVAGHFGLETAIDEAAWELRVDPLKFRTDLLKSGELHHYTSSGIDECIARGASAAGWSKKWRPPDTRSNRRSKRHGIGVAIAEYHAMIDKGEADVAINPDGTLEVHVGVVDVGTGAKTTMAIIAGEEFGVDPKDVRVVWGDTDLCPFSIGESGGRTTASTGMAVTQATRELKRRVLELAARSIGTDPSDLYIDKGQVKSRRDSKKKVSLSRLASSTSSPLRAYVSTNPKVPEGTERASFAAAFAEVDVDEETGKVDVARYVAAHDSGHIVNELTARSQVLGCIAMGMSWAFHEEYVCDDVGNVVTADLWNYHVQRQIGIPDAKVLFVETEDPYGPKTIGEVSVVLVAPAVSNAIFNATGARIREMPFTPFRVRKAILERDRAT